ncbi:MAG: MFS transporter [Rhodospirillaceae bacterium]|nr:MFS transporter [Rhodospirillaceae bacterium]
MKALLRSPSPYVLVACAALILALGMGMRNTFGLFLQPMSLDLQLPRGVFALAIAIQMLAWGISQPIFGALADRYGAARIVVLGGLFYASGLLLMANASGPWALHGGIGILVGMGTSAAGFAVVLGPVGRAFPPEKRSMALGVASAGGSAGQLIMALVGGALIDSMGWAAALLVMAIIAAFIIPLALGVRGKSAGDGGPAQSLREALREASGNKNYWLLCAGFFVCGFHVAFIATHLPPYLADNDMPTMLAATAIAIIGFFNILGTLASGWLGGKYRQNYVLSIYYLARAVIIAGFLIFPVTETSVLIFAALMGFMWLGTVPLTSGLVAQIFGARYLGALFGIVFFSHQIGGFLGAWLGGYLFDLTGNYDVAWMIAIALGVLAALIHWPISDRPIIRTTEGA